LAGAGSLRLAEADEEAFKPIEPGLKLRPEETQLFLAYIGEILKELEDEEIPNSLND
jgi:hypothetical protein